MQPENAGCIGCCLGPVADCSNHFLLLVRVQFGGPAKLCAAIAGGRQAGAAPTDLIIFRNHEPVCVEPWRLKRCLQPRQEPYETRRVLLMTRSMRYQHQRERFG
jgi:hypothetical protein